MYLKKIDFLKWFLVALSVKLIIFIISISIIKDNNNMSVDGFWSFISGDSNSYLVPIDRLIHLGEYAPDYRMPGYGAFYLFFRMFFEKSNALNSLILLQLLVSSISVVYLAKLGEVIFQERKYFYLIFFTYLAIPYVHFFDAYVLTESLATSFLIFFTFHLVQYLKQFKTKNIFFAGLFLSVVVFMKPVYFPLFGLIPFLLLFYLVRKVNNWKKIIFAYFLFGLPFLVFDSVWTVRNFIQNKKFSFLHNGFHYPDLANDLIVDLWGFCTTIGENFAFWEDEDAKVQWFFYDVDSLKQNNPIDEDIEFSPDIYTSKFSRDSLIALVELRNLYLAKKDEWSDEKLDKVKIKFKNKIESYIHSYKVENPFNFYIIASFKSLIEFFEEPVGYYRVDKKSLVQRIILTIYYFEYIMILILGLIGGMLALKKENQSIYFFSILLIAAYTIVIFPIILRLVENRYLVMAFPFIILIGAKPLMWIFTFVYKMASEVC